MRPYPAPDVPTAFEEQVKKLRLNEQTCVASEELKQWCKRNKDRCYIRCPVEVPATLRRPGMQEVRGHVANISEGGIAIITGVLLKPGVEVQVQFTLPGYESQFEVKSAICWCRDGYMGLRFISLSAELKTKLQDWLSRRMKQSLPESVANKFRTLVLQ